MPLLCAALLPFGNALQAAQPIAFEPEAYNVDIVYENVPIGALSRVTATQDDDSVPSQTPEMQTGGDDRSWPETGLVVRGVTSQGMPVDRTIVAGNSRWVLQPYTENNAMQLQNMGRGSPLSRTMTLRSDARVPYGKLDWLHAAAPDNVTYTVRLNFTDGTSAELGQNFVSLQWGNTYSVNRALGSHRVSTNITYPSPFPAYIRAGNDDGIAGGGNWGIYHQGYDLVAVGLHQKALLSITFTNYNASNLTVFAVSGDALGIAAPPMELEIRNVPGAAELTWNRGILQESPEVAGPWTDLPNAVSPHYVNVSEGRHFFRVRE